MHRTIRRLMVQYLTEELGYVRTYAAGTCASTQQKPWIRPFPLHVVEGDAAIELVAIWTTSAK